MNLFEVESKHSEDLSAVDSWCDEIYQKNFSKYFSDQRSLFDRLRSKSHPITDQELEWILTKYLLISLMLLKSYLNFKHTKKFLS